MGTTFLDAARANHPLPDAPVFATLRAMITIRETLVVDAEGHAVITLPPSVKPGAHRAVLHIEVEDAPVPADHGGLIGMWRGKIGFLPGWDEPVEDFREYLE